MSSYDVNTLENYRIPLKEIKLGTNNFSEESYLGGGGFGKVYRGTLSESRPIRTAAFKRLNLKGFQGKREFMNELSFLSSFHHENIIAFIGYCDEGDEMIIAYEYASNKSLDHYLLDTNKMRFLTWEQRLHICIGSARGLNHLHWGLGTNHRVIHRDVKSGNILLNDKLVAKISDFGLSKFSPKNQPVTQLNTTIAGTLGYCDPDYYESSILRKESDVYSFGVVLFEVLCGRLVSPKQLKEGDKSDDSQTLVVLTRRHKENLHKIIDPNIRDQIDSKSLDIFTGIACQCIERKYKKRPKMTDILEKLEEAMSIQENSDLVKWEKLLPRNYQEIIQRSDSPVAYKNKGELYSLLFNGILIDGGKKRFSLSKKYGKNCLMISSMELFEEKDPYIIGWESFEGLRFSKVASFQCGGRQGDYVHEKAMHVTASMLSLETTYAIFVICKYTGNKKKAHKQSSPPNIYFSFCHGKENMRVNSAEWKDESWMEMKLFQFTNHLEVENFELHLRWENVSHGCGLYVEGIEFRPIKVENSDYWEKLLPHNYEEIIQRSYQPVVYKNKQELYSLLSVGIFIDGGKKWFSLSEMNRKNCLVISAMTLFEENDERLIGWESFPNSRFSYVACFKHANNRFVHEKAMHVTAPMLSLESTYAVFIICKYTGKEHKAQNNSTRPEIYFCLNYGDKKICLSSVEWKDEWMQVELFKFINHMEVSKFELHLDWMAHLDYGLYVEGIEFRPIEMPAYMVDENKVEQLMELESDKDWEKKLPSDYEEVISGSTKALQFTTKKKLYSLTTGISLYDNSMWLGASNRKKCILLSAMCLKVKHVDGSLTKVNYNDPRFSTSLNVSDFLSLEIGCKIKAHMLSPKTPYAAWLVYDRSLRTHSNIASLTLGKQEKKTRHVYLDDSSITILPMNDPNYRKGKFINVPTESVKLDRRTSKRDDFMYEVELFPFFNDMDAHDEVEVGLHIDATSASNYIAIKGIEFRPQ